MFCDESRAVHMPHGRFFVYTEPPQRDFRFGVIVDRNAVELEGYGIDDDAILCGELLLHQRSRRLSAALEVCQDCILLSHKRIIIRSLFHRESQACETQNNLETDKDDYPQLQL